MEQDIPAAAQAIVIGGGAMGCSTAYHLAKLGCRDVILLEREKLTSGTTWHAAGLVRQLRATANLTSLIRYGVGLYASLEAETGQSTGWSQTGSLSVAAHPDRFIHIKRMASLAKMFGLPADVVDLKEAQRLWPLCRTDDLVGAVWSPSDGRVNPSDLCAAYAKGARLHGARIFEGVKVTGIDVRNGRVAGVQTDRDLRLSPLHDRLAAKGAEFHERGGWERPVVFRRGGFESDVTVMRWAEDAFLLVTGAVQGVRDAVWIRRHLGPDDFVTVADVTSAYAVLGVMGPKSREVLLRAGAGGLDNDSHPYLRWRNIEVGHAVVRAARVTYVGELGWELHVPTEFARGVYDVLHEAGARLGLLDAGYHALGSLRIEKGYRAWGAELSPDETPFEAGLGFAVKLDKGAFSGRQALLGKRAEGPPRKRLLQLRAEDAEAFLHGGEPILWRGRHVGQITSAAFGHTIGRPVAMGYVRAVDDASVADMVGAGGFEAEIALRRFPISASFSAWHDPKGERLRA